MLHRSGNDVAANVIYVVHMMGVVPMLVLEVPFSKWAHLAYRPLAHVLLRAAGRGHRGPGAGAGTVTVAGPQPA